MTNLHGMLHSAHPCVEALGIGRRPFGCPGLSIADAAVSPQAAVHVGAIGFVARAAASALLRTLLTTLLRRFGCSFLFMLLRSQPQGPNLASPHHNKTKDRRQKHCLRTLAEARLFFLCRPRSSPSRPAWTFRFGCGEGSGGIGLSTHALLSPPSPRRLRSMEGEHGSVASVLIPIDTSGSARS